MINSEYRQMNMPVSAGVDFDPFALYELEGTAPATEQQREIWAAAQLCEEASASYNLPAALRIRGELDIDSLSAALRQMLDRHDAFRLSFTPDGETLCFARHVDVPLRIEDSSEKELASIYREEGATPFNLVQGPLIRFRLIKFSPEDHMLIVTAHHVVWDGWSIGVFFRELLEIYAACRNGHDAALDAAPSFREYAIELTSQQQRERRVQQEAAWIERLAGMPDFLQLPVDGLRPPIRTFKAGYERYELNRNTRQALENLAERSGCTLFITLASAFFAFLHRLSGQSKIVTGVPAAGQVNANTPGLLGHCVSMLPVPSQLSPDASFMEFLRETRNILLDATEDRDCSFGKILERLNLSRDASTVPLVQVVFNFDRVKKLTEVGGLDCEFSMPPKPYENFEWFVNALAGPDSLVIECTYKSELFDAGTMRQRLEELETFIIAAAEHPEKPVMQLRVLPDSEIRMYSNVAAIPMRENSREAQHLENAAILVVDDAGYPVPVGVAGELVVRGDDAVLRYLGKPHAVGKVLFSDSFENPGSSQHLYHTGERVRLSAGGKLEMLGRQEERIERNGRRIEPADIETRILQHDIQRAVVVLHTGDESESLVAHIAPSNMDDFDPQSLRQRLQEELPGWMLPDYFVVHNELPVTASGRIDRKLLASWSLLPEAPESSQSYTVIERKLTRVWRQVLGVESIGASDDFFEAGGHSLLAARIVAILREEFAVDLPMTAIFVSPSIARLARRRELAPLAAADNPVEPAREEFEI